MNNGVISSNLFYLQGDPLIKYVCFIRRIMGVNVGSLKFSIASVNVASAFQFLDVKI